MLPFTFLFFSSISPFPSLSLSFIPSSTWLSVEEGGECLGHRYYRLYYYSTTILLSCCPDFHLTLSLSPSLSLSHSLQIPVVVESCIRFINLHGLHHEGIFRVPGSQREVNHIRDAFERGTHTLP
uniref:Rho-GAP domain-containing protein n=1 Tax=Hucho hucho TaxID=62062 RepID=A0A4W5L1J6_9TELE